MKKMNVFLLCLFILTFTGTASALTVTPMDSAQNLAKSLLGSGISISNVSYTGVTSASGYFSGGTTSGLGFDNGIVLTSGSASILNSQKNISDNYSKSNGLAGDVNLNKLIPGYTTHDATVLQFDFVVATGTNAFFNFAFGSEEYNEWVNSAYNDVFGFFFNGKNIALIPGTTTPVSINNINGYNNSKYFHNNDPSDFKGKPPYAMEYDGFTDSFTASLNNLVAGNTYHIKLAIADAGDSILDSGVFLQGHSFSDGPSTGNNPVPEPATFILIGSGLMYFGASARRKQKSEK